MLSTLRGSSLFLLAALCALPVTAQCDPSWSGTDAPSTLTGTVWNLTTWDPDGAGPQPANLVTAGRSNDSTQPVDRVARFDGTRWTMLGDAAPGGARCVVNWNGTLVADLSSGISTWNGTAWQPIAGPTPVLSMAVFNNELVVAGQFSSIGGVPANRIAKWNGASWSALGSGVSGSVYAMHVFQNVLWLGGSFSNAGGLTVNNLAIWNGTTWVAGPAANGTVWSMASRLGTALTQTFLFVGGEFTTLNGVAAQHVARYSPSANTWTALGAGLPGTECGALLVTATGLNTYDLVAGTDAPGGNRVFRWDGPSTTWIGLGTGGNAIPACLGRWNGQLVCGGWGASPTAGPVSIHTGSAWTPLSGSGIAGRVTAVLADGSATIVGGTFATISGVAMGGIARGTPGNWSPLGGGTDGVVVALARMPNGDVIAGGSFTTAGGVPANNIARWNGTTWSALGAGTNSSVLALAVMPNGDLVAGGYFTHAGGGIVNRIARWNGAFWSSLGAGVNAEVFSLLACSNGDLVAGGEFSDQGSAIARWNGFLWSPMGSGSQSVVSALAEMADGRVLASGWFGSNTFIAAWDGTAWTAPHTTGAAPPIQVTAFRRLADGSIAAVGNAYPTIDASARLQNGAWSPLAVPHSAIFAIDQAADGTLCIGGDFLGDGSFPAKFAARDVPCPAVASTFAPGCPSSGGANALTTTTLPWVNGTFRAAGTGLPATALVLAVTSVQPIVPPLPLDVVFAQAGPGCNLHVVPDILGLLVTTTGTVVSELALPNTPPLVGVTFFHQLLPIELDALGNWTAVTATNALQLVAGIL